MLKGGEQSAQLADAQTSAPSALTSVSGTLSFTNPLPKAPLAILHPRRIFLEIGLFSGLYKPEVSEYIASRSKARQEDFRNGKPSSRAITAFTAYLL